LKAGLSAVSINSSEILLMKSHVHVIALRATVILLGLLSGAPVYADEEQESPWSGSARFGYLATTGNTNTDSINGRFLMKYQPGSWKYSAFAGGFGAREDSRTTAEAYEAGGSATYDFNAFDYAFGRVNWRKDKFSGFDQQISEAIGYGRRLINLPRQHLNVEIGAGARQSRRRTDESQNEAILRLGSDYEFRFNEVAAFNFDLSMESGSDNTFAEAIAALKTKLLGRLAMVASYTVRHNSSVPAGNARTDTFTALSLEYKF
jgi:putative salt-induced outer membrane protein